jgi:hypothetical protein
MAFEAVEFGSLITVEKLSQFTPESLLVTTYRIVCLDSFTPESFLLIQ